MKLLVIVSLAVLALVRAEVEEEHEYMQFPDGDGNLHLIDLKEKVPDADRSAERVNSVFFQLFTRNNPTSPQILVLNNVNSIRNSRWSAARQTRIITHGWRSAHNSDACVVIRNAYLAVGDYNVIVVDWSQLAGQIYSSSASSVRPVAERVAQMINFLRINGGLNPGTTKIVGHSLGGHIAGLSARFARATGAPIGSVLALDPALPLFDNAGPGSRVDASDANYVQVIHTNGGLLGIMNPIGDADFYPNGGRSQPGCGLDVAGTCAHSRAYFFTAESIRNPTGFRAANNIFMGGRYLSTHARGSFQLTTNASPPYARG